MRRPLVAGNWKMHGNVNSVNQLLHALAKQTWQQAVDVAVFPPTLFTLQAIEMLKNTPIKIGAQNCATEPKEGALTGEISANQLANAGCGYVLIGHSERRLLLGDTPEMILKKFVCAEQEGLIPILCLGETKEQHEKNQTFEVITSQLDSIINQLGIQILKKAVIAYEPVWAIGTGNTATPEQAQAIHAFIREHLAKQHEHIAQAIQILYGGSVKANNAKKLFAMPDIDGALIGGASLNAEEFNMIYHAAGNN